MIQLNKRWYSHRDKLMPYITIVLFNTYFASVESHWVLRFNIDIIEFW